MILISNLIPLIGSLFALMASSFFGARMLLVFSTITTLLFKIICSIDLTFVNVLKKRIAFSSILNFYNDSLATVFGIIISFLFLLFSILDFSESEDKNRTSYVALFLMKESALLFAVSIKAMYFFYFMAVCIIGLNFVSIGNWCTEDAFKNAKRYLTTQTLSISILFVLITFLKIKYPNFNPSRDIFDIKGISSNERKFLEVMFFVAFCIIWGIVPIKNYFKAYINKFNIESLSIFSSGAIFAMYGILRFVILFFESNKIVDLILYISLPISAYLVVMIFIAKGLERVFLLCTLQYVYPIFMVVQQSMDSVSGYLIYFFGNLLSQSALLFFISIFKKNATHGLETGYNIFFQNKLYNFAFLMSLLISGGFPLGLGFNGFVGMIFSVRGFHNALLMLGFVVVFVSVMLIYHEISISEEMDVEANKSIFFKDVLLFEFIFIYSFLFMAFTFTGLGGVAKLVVEQLFLGISFS